ncbi:MAG: FAD-dependent oxidoreductase [Planctomycetaceae bacterium]|nr:FAD-dependent oxidoreductase [Planctomycetaceae bacterium]
MNIPRPFDTLIVGAGLAGLAAARELGARGRSVLLLDKGRTAGGRASTRRVEHPALGALSFDHGAQFATARGEAFRALCEELRVAGEVVPWSPRWAWLGTPSAEPEGRGIRWIAMPGCSQWGRGLASRLGERAELRTSVTVSELVRAGELWWAVDTSGERHGPARSVLVTAPAPQSRALLAPHDAEMAEALAAVSYAPCIAAMAAWLAPLDLPFDLAEGSSHLGLVVREASKPGRPAAEALVLHGAPDWSAAHLDDDPRASARALLDELSRALGRGLPEPAHLDAHRWRYAAVLRAIGKLHLAAHDLPLFAAGDSCLGPRLEFAFESGLSAARAIVAL